ncbi:MAG: EamA family transporter [Bacteroidetes bacterium]|nr:EamA family transporter [Bacteroidota bacterium]
MNPKNRNLLLLHLIIFIWGWTAVLGKIITLPTLQLIWLRVMIAFIGILAYALYKKTPLFPSGKIVLQLLGIGLIVGVHWICFYGAVKASNVSVTLACCSTGTLFTSLIEPIVYKTKVLWYEIFFGLVVIGALLMIFNVETKYTLGILLGIGSALTYSIMTVTNSIMSRKNIGADVISVYEMIGCWICISIFLFSLEPSTATVSGISAQDWFYLLVLAVVCTTVPFIVGVAILRNISPYTMSLTLNLETIYGILFAFFIFKSSEIMSPTFYIGAVVILVVVFADAWIKSKR